MGIREVLQANEEKDLLRLLTAGSVDDGKSTLIGRLLYDSKDIYEDHLQSLQRDSKRLGATGGAIDYSLLVDGLKAEREQGITIDVAYRYFSTPKRKFIIADCPGHVQYTRNMATGASTANLAIILIDAENGVLEQTRRHSFIASLLGINHLLVAVNKMDLVDWSEDRFEDICRDYRDFAARLEAKNVHFVPISALEGDNVVVESERMSWYRGGPLLDHLENVHIAADRNFIDLRFPVQYVVRHDQHFRGYAGTVASGILRPGAEVMALPSRKRTRVERVTTWEGDLDEACPPMAVNVTLADDIDVSRGDMLVHPENLPTVSKEFEAVMVWLAEEPLKPKRPYIVKHSTTMAQGEVASIRYRFDISTLHRDQAASLGLNDIGRVHIELSRPLAFDSYARNRATGCFILVDPISNGTVAAGMILDRRIDEAPGEEEDAPDKSYLEARTSSVTAEQRADRLKQRGAVVWLTGLTRAGKTTIAYAVERHLFGDGYLVNVVDGENLRLGLSGDLGFGALARAENIRRAAHVAKVCADAGLITVIALVSPYAADRAAARELVGADRFLEVHVDAPVEVCESRDTQGLYARARAGDIDDFTGISAPYEPPEAADLRLPTAEVSIDESVERITALLRERGVLLRS